MTKYAVELHKTDKFYTYRKMSLVNAVSPDEAEDLVRRKMGDRSAKYTTFVVKVSGDMAALDDEED